MAEHQYILEVAHMYKNFGVTVALNDVSFALERGKVYGLVGENGSGKSTVSSIIAGVQPASKGQMRYEGKEWNPSTMLEAQQHGIGMIVQEAGTIPNITVAENIFLGHENKFKRGAFIDRRRLTSAAQKLLDELGITDFRAADRTGDLDIQMRKIIEICKCMYWKPNILIVDETSTALSLEGRQFLYKTMRQQVEENKTVLFISHDLDEIMEQCDKLTVLRDGVVIGTLDKTEYEPNRIRQMMVGRELKGDYYRSDYKGYSDEVVLKADNVTTLSELMCFNLELHRGEILGIGGLSECGMHMVGRALFGIEEVLDGSVVRVENEKEARIDSSISAIKNKMAYVSKNRDTESLGLSATIYENIASTGYKTNAGLFNLISFKKENRYVDEQIDGLKIKCTGKHYPVNTLSGGNKQKVVFGKWVASDAEVLILDCPTRGIDVGVKAAMYRLINGMKEAGKAIVLISEELQELIGMCDRILIMKDGRVSHEVMRSENPTESSLVDYMI